MFNQLEYRAINKELEKKQKIRRKKLITIWGILLGISAIIIIALLLIFEIYTKDDDVAWIFYFFSGSTVLVLAIGLIISTNFKSEKPYFEYLFSQIIAKINDEEGLYLSYDAYPKLEKTFNEEGGLFPKGVSISSKRVVNGYSKEQHPFQIIDCAMTTQSGNSQVTHFHGSYFYIQKPGQTDLQIRTNGSPKIKSEKYEKMSEEGPLKIFKPVGNDLLDIDQRYVNFMSQLNKDKMFRHIYLGINQQNYHVALWYRKNPMRKKKDFSLDTLNQYYKDFMFEIDLINELENLS